MGQRATYGIDAPRVVGAFAALGILFAASSEILLIWPAWPGVPPALGPAAGTLGALLAACTGVMLWSSRVGKMRVRDRLVAALTLDGDARVLDAGCGRGLALIGCAKALTTGKAIGIDLWAAHLSANRPEATRANAVLEAVADRVEIETGDITSLPFEGESFDAIISMTVIHNIASQDARDRAIGELIRVLKPGGRIAIFDLLHMDRYGEVLRRAGLTVEALGVDWLWFMPCRSLLARKPGRDVTQGAQPVVS